MKLLLKFQFERKTKGAVRYQERSDLSDCLAKDDGTSIVGMLYIRKLALGQSRPQVLSVTITDEG